MSSVAATKPVADACAPAPAPKTDRCTRRCILSSTVLSVLHTAEQVMAPVHTRGDELCRVHAVILVVHEVAVPMIDTRAEA